MPVTLCVDTPKFVVGVEDALRLSEARQLLSRGELEAGVKVLQALAPVNPEASVLFSVCLRHGIGVSAPQPTRGLHILLLLAAAEYVPAMVEAALQLRSLFHISGVHDEVISPPDDARSLRLLNRALELEPYHSTALNARAIAYLYGRGCPRDVKAAIECFNTAATLGFVEAKTWLGKIYVGQAYYVGKAKAIDSVEKGVALLESAAKSNCSFVGHASQPSRCRFLYVCSVFGYRLTGHILTLITRF
jgi:TPR repeat protein